MGRVIGGLNRHVDPEKGRQDYEDLGGLSDSDYLRLREFPNADGRWRYLRGTFGHNGAAYAWTIYLKHRDESD